MVDHTTRYRPYDLDSTYTQSRPIAEWRPYKFEPSGFRTRRSVPAFLSDYDGEPDPSEYVTPLRKHGRRSVSARILAGILATAAAAILFAMFSSDATRAIIANAKASIAASLPSALANQTPGVRAVTTAAVGPTREEITTAYQSAMRTAARATPRQARPDGCSRDGGRSAAGRDPVPHAAGKCRSHDPGRAISASTQ